MVLQQSGGTGSMVPHIAQPFGNAEARIYSAGSVLAVFIAVLAFRWLSSLPKTSHFPLLGQQTGTSAQKRQYFLQNAQKVFQEGYQKFRTRVWRTESTDGSILILPILAADEVNKQPDHVVSRDVANDRTFETKLLGITFATPLMVHIVKADLTRHIPLLTQQLSGEVQRSIHEALGSHGQYAEVNVFPKLLRVVAIVSGLAFVGPGMYRQEEYITNSITFTVDLFGAIAKLKAWPNWGPVRAIAARFIAPVKRLHMHRQKAYDYFIPRIQERRKTTADQEADAKPKDMLQWMINKADKFDIKNDEEIAMILILLGVAAIHTTTLTVVHILYDLIGHCPDVIPELRKEIQTAIDAQGGKFTSEALYQMKLLDSVMRESARLNPTNVMRMQRSVLQSFQLLDGTVIPAGVDIAVPALPVNLDESKYPDALRFDPYRFVRLRSGEKPDPIGYTSRELYQFISVTKENMAFGFGKPACPGRFFAAVEIKLILIFILIDYDIKMPDGLEGRYANNFRGTSITPDFSKSIMIRRRDKA